MYRWYENARVCYAYLHDFPDPLFLTASDDERYPNSNGWPEWFSRGWTLQEMVAPSDVQFFNKDWHPIGDKSTLAPALADITGIPVHILIHELRGNRPCVAQIMSWAAHRTTTRVEDRAYSLLGLLDVNMPMLYGEGKKAFHRLQLEIIRASNDQSIFAWGCNVRTGNILADDPSFFEDCDAMELMDHDEFIQFLKQVIPEEELPFIEKDRFGVFPVTNRGIQIWLLFRSDATSDSVFQAWLPCRFCPMFPPATIDLVLWEDDYYRYPYAAHPYSGGSPQLRHVYLRYQDPPHRNATFEIDDSTLTENGFTHCSTYPEKFTGNRFTLTGTDPICVKVYFDSQADCRFAVGFGQSFGKDWIHVVSEELTRRRPSWESYALYEHHEMVCKSLDHAQTMNKARSGPECNDRLFITQIRLNPSTWIPQTWILQTSFVVWKRSRMCGVKLDVSRVPGFGKVSSKWTDFDVDVRIFLHT